MIFVSACLIGENYKYNGGNNLNNKVMDFLKDKEYMAICPEVSGGLSTPRDPSEIENGAGNKVLNGEAKVFSDKGEDVTVNFLKGAYNTLKLAEKYNPELIILKAKSPSCGKGKTYDGTFSKTIVVGNGVTSELLIKNGYKIITEDEL